MFRETFTEKIDRKRERLLSHRRLGDYTELPRFFRDSGEYQRDGCFSSCYGKFLELWKNLGRLAAKAIKMGKPDPRNVVFSAKMGLALILVSLLYLLKVPLKDSLWAALTVVIVFEFSIGFYTTYAKLHPSMKLYEYGIPVFPMVCCFIMVSGYGTRKFIETAVTPFLLIALGAGVSFLVNISIYPVWAGQDLHNLVAQHFLSIASSLEGCINAYIQCVEYERIPSQILTFQASDDPVYCGY